MKRMGRFKEFCDRHSNVLIAVAAIAGTAILTYFFITA
jgi:hypothetical protein